MSTSNLNYYNNEIKHILNDEAKISFVNEMQNQIELNNETSSTSVVAIIDEKKELFSKLQ